MKTACRGIAVPIYRASAAALTPHLRVGAGQGIIYLASARRATCLGFLCAAAVQKKCFAGCLLAAVGAGRDAG